MTSHEAALSFAKRASAKRKAEATLPTQGIHGEVYDDELSYRLGQVEDVMRVYFEGLLRNLGHLKGRSTAEVHLGQILRVHAEAHHVFTGVQASAARAKGVGLYGAVYPDAIAGAGEGYITPGLGCPGLPQRFKGLVQSVAPTRPDAVLQ